jgi:RNA polymerase sigma factor (TIGR02999 family)
MIRELYPELRRLAGALLRRERPDHTLQRTALVNELFVRVSRRAHGVTSDDRRFLALAAHEMRQILVDHGRAHRSLKRGGDVARVPLFDIDLGFSPNEDAILDLNDALDRLGKLDPRYLSVVELKFFAGFTNAETAEILGVSDATVESIWQYSRLWLFKELAALRPGHSPLLIRRLLANPNRRNETPPTGNLAPA